MKRLILVQLICFVLFGANTLLGQKKIIDYQAFDEWKTLKNEQVSMSGKYITYEIQPLKGDTYLYWYNTETAKLDSVYKAKDAKFILSEDFLIYTIEAGYDTLRKVELAKVDKKKWPKDTLAIYSFTTNKFEKVGSFKKYETSVKHNWLAYTENENLIKEKDTSSDTKSKAKKKNKKKKKKSSDDEKEVKSEGKVFRLLNIESNEKYVFKDVTDFLVSEKGESVVFTQNQKDSSTISILNLASKKTITLDKKFTAVSSFVFDENVEKLSFLASMDTTKTKVFALYSYVIEKNKLDVLIDTTSKFIPSEWTVSKNATPQFSKINNRLYFGVFDVPEYDMKDTLTEIEKAKLDIWHYNEPVLHTEQLANLDKDLKKTYWYYYDLDKGIIVGLENDTIKIQSNFNEQTNVALARNKRTYELEFMWDISGYEDYYQLDMSTGKTKLIQKGIAYAEELSRKGDKFVYFDNNDDHYYAIDLLSDKKNCLTCNVKGRTWTLDQNGMPNPDEPLGTLGWNKAGTQLYMREKNDFFMYDFPKEQLINLTNNMGFDNNIELKVRKWDNDSTFSELNDFYLIGLDKVSKGSHLYLFENDQFVKKGYWDAKITTVKKAKNAAVYILRMQNVKDYPDVYYWKDDSAQIKKISVTNPQQSEYNWASVELISWKAYDGEKLQGLVYKPENYDSTKHYPLLVYFYELYSDNLHNHYTPRPTASIIFPTEYASAGYFVFIPDIRYQPGHPAKSAYNCIMSGTDAVINKYAAIDSTRMGLQGQSWGGYQTAQLVTMTTRYKAAMAGAPVGNMFSAYGGIRWKSGMSRQFQYEKTQSRIGKTIWEAPELYVENSPIFHLPNVETPLLIMHNDGDGAVPWYQSIEIFTGMRRLRKPCWLLNYNGDDHNLMKIANRRDLSIRMRQFFDYYLQDQSAPLWLTKGIPAVKKDKENRYELDKD